MYQTFIADSQQLAAQPRLAESMYRLRHKVFKEKLDWDVPSHDGLEYDEFDDADAVYVIARCNASGEVIGCCRLRPTHRPYMLKDTFPMLLEGEPAPEVPNAWEISRLAVINTPYADARFGIGDISQDLITDSVDFATAEHIARYVVVTSVSLERMTRHIGYRPERMGPPTRIGRVRTIAIQFPIDDNTRRVASLRKLSRLDQVAA